MGKMVENESFLIEMNRSLQNPYPFYAELRKQSPIVYSKTLDTYFVGRYQTCHNILKEKEFGHTPNDSEGGAPILEK